MLKRLNLCLAAIHFFPAYSGAGIQFQRYRAGFEERGIDMWTLAGTPPGYGYQKVIAVPDGVRYGEWFSEEEVEGLRVERVYLPQNGNRSRTWAYVPALLRACREPELKPDVIQVLSSSIYWLPWWHAIRKLDIPTIYSYTLIQAMSSNYVKALLQRFLQRSMISMFDCVVTNTHVGKDLLLQSNAQTRIEAIGNGVDTAYFRPARDNGERERLREKLSLPVDAPVILFVGAQVRRKGLDVLLEAWPLIANEFPDAHLVLVGPDYRGGVHPEPQFGQYVKELLDSANVPERTIVTGTVDNVEEYFRAADVFVFPSRREGMGTVVLESFATGLPTILCKFVGLPDDFGSPGETYILVERTPEAIDSAVHDLLTYRPFAQLIGSAARQWAVEHLAIEYSINAYADLYFEYAGR